MRCQRTKFEMGREEGGFEKEREQKCDTLMLSSTAHGFPHSQPWFHSSYFYGCHFRQESCHQKQERTCPLKFVCLTMLVRGSIVACIQYSYLLMYNFFLAFFPPVQTLGIFGFSFWKYQIRTIGISGHTYLSLCVDLQIWCDFIRAFLFLLCKMYVGAWLRDSFQLVFNG